MDIVDNFVDKGEFQGFTALDLWISSDELWIKITQIIRFGKIKGILHIYTRESLDFRFIFVGEYSMIDKRKEGFL